MDKLKLATFTEKVKLIGHQTWLYFSSVDEEL